MRPGNGKCWWQVETDWFSEAVFETPCVGVVKEVIEAVLVMELYNSSEEEDLEVGKKMIKLGLAKEEWKRSLF